MNILRIRTEGHPRWMKLSPKQAVKVENSPKACELTVATLRIIKAIAAGESKEDLRNINMDAYIIRGILKPRK